MLRELSIDEVTIISGGDGRSQAARTGAFIEGALTGAGIGAGIGAFYGAVPGAVVGGIIGIVAGGGWSIYRDYQI